MALPRSEIVARPMLPRACGCMCEFQHYAVDRYRAERLAKFQSTRCPECVAKDEEQQRQAKAELPTKGDTFKELPDGASFTLTRVADGKWKGSLTIGGEVIEGLADSPQGLPLTLSRRWLLARNKSKAKP